MERPRAEQFKCKRKNCVFRCQNKFSVHACDYAAMTGRPRTRRDKPADTRNCEYYVPMIKGARRRGYSLTGPVWAQIAASLHAAGYSPEAIAQIVSADPDAVKSFLENKDKVKTAPRKYKTLLSGFDWDKARKLYNQGASDQQIAKALGCSKQRVFQWRDMYKLPCHNPKGKKVEE